MTAKVIRLADRRASRVCEVSAPFHRESPIESRSPLRDPLKQETFRLLREIERNLIAQGDHPRAFRQFRVMRVHQEGKQLPRGPGQ